jgi:ABC-type phosphate transport system substrate-binding protein
MKIHQALLLTILYVVATPAKSYICFKDALTIAGSTTVYPVAVQWATSYADLCPDSNVTVDWELFGSTVGAKRVCADPLSKPIEIATMTRSFKDPKVGQVGYNVSDAEAVLQPDGYTYKCAIGNTTRSVAQLPAFYDAVVLLVNGGGDSAVAKCIETLGGGLNMDQIRWLFSNFTESQLKASNWSAASLPNSDGDDETHLWSELDSSCPDVEVAIAGDDTVGRLSGEAEFFQRSFFPGYKGGPPLYSSAEGLRSAYESFIDHKDVNKYVLDTDGAIGFNSYQTAASAVPGVMLVPIKSTASGAHISPTKETIQKLTYLPLSRLASMNLLTSDCTALLNGLSFLEYTYTPDGQDDIAATYGVPLTEEDIKTATERIKELRTKCPK